MHFYVVSIVAMLSLPWPSFALEPDQVFAKVSPSVVVVYAYKSSDRKNGSFGSGVIVSPGQIVTNCHVVNGADIIHLNREKYTTVGIIRFSDPERDLCQIGATNISGFDRAVPRIASTTALKVGQKVFAIGAPQGLELTLSDGLISSLRELPEGTLIQTTAPVSHGSSGGGLFDSSGRLIGITTFIFKDGQNLNFAVPASWISELAPRQQAREDAARNAIEEAAAAKAKLEAEERQAEEIRRIEEKRRVEERQRVEQARREEDQRQRAAAAELERERQEVENKQRELAEARDSAGLAVPGARKSRIVDEYRRRIQGRIKNRILIPPNMEGNPEARFAIVLIPGGELLSVTIEKSSGVPAYDAEVERAIFASQPLPVPSDTDIFQQHFHDLTLVFRPFEAAALSNNGTTVPGGNTLPRSAAQPDIVVSGTERSLIEQYQQIVSDRIKAYEEYPSVARRRGWQGTTVIQLRLATDNVIAEVLVVKKSGHEELDEAAIRMVRKASPLPPPPEGLRGREHSILVPINFALSDRPEPSKQKQIAVDAMSSIQQELNRVAKASNDSNGLPAMIERRPAEAPKASGEIGEMERFAKEFLDLLVAQRNDYLLELDAIGWNTVLSAQRVKNDDGLSESRAMLNRAKVLVDKYKKKTADLLTISSTKIDSLAMSESNKRALRDGFNKGLSRAQTNIDEQWALERKVVDQFENIFVLLNSRNNWYISGEKILFATKDDLDQFNLYIASIQQLVARQQEISARSVAEANRTAEEFKQ